VYAFVCMSCKVIFRIIWMIGLFMMIKCLFGKEVLKHLGIIMECLRM